MPIEIIDRRRLDAICGKLPVGPGPDPAGKKARGGSARNAGLSAIVTGIKRQIRARAWRANTRTTVLIAERVAGDSGHALSGQK